MKKTVIKLETEVDNNPFLTEQLILCSQHFFSDYPRRQQQALQLVGIWSLLMKRTILME